METQKIKKPFYKKVWFWIIVLIILYSIGSNQTSKTGNVQVDKNNIGQTTTAEKQYQEVFKFSGNGQKKSEPFTITGSRFKIAYDCKGDTSATYCGAFVFRVGSQLPQGVMNSAKPIKDETVIYGSGEYYIDANTMGNFTMTVYDYK